MFIKLIPLFFFALIIDGFQFLVALALAVIMAAPGTIGGAVAGGIAGNYLCSGLGSSAAGACAAVGAAFAGFFGSYANVPLAVVGEPIGLALGFAISICISLTLGTMLVLFLFLMDMLDKKAVVLTYVGEGLPGLNMLPAWTALVARCAYTSYKKAAVRKLVEGVSGIASNLTLPDSELGDVMREGASIGSGGLAREMSQEEFMALQEEKGGSARQNTPTRRGSLPMQDIRTRPQNNRDTIDRYAEAA